MVGFNAKEEAKLYAYIYKDNNAKEVLLDMPESAYANRLSLFYKRDGLYLVGFYNKEQGNESIQALFTIRSIRRL